MQISGNRKRIAASLWAKYVICGRILGDREYDLQTQISKGNVLLLEKLHLLKVLVSQCLP